LHSNLLHINLLHTNLSHANIYAHLSHANLSHANLSHANLSHANLLHANLTNLFIPTSSCQPLTCQPLTYHLLTNLFHTNLQHTFSHIPAHTIPTCFPPPVSHSHFPPATSLALDPHVCPPHVPHSPCFPILVTHAPFCFLGTTARSLESSPLEWARRMERQVVQRCRWRQARHIHMAGAMSCDQRGDVHGGCAV